MSIRKLRSLGKVAAIFLMSIAIFAQTLILSQTLLTEKEVMRFFNRGLVKEAERRKQQRYALIRESYADVMFNAVQNDAVGTVAAYLRFVGLREFYLPRKPLGYYVGRGTPLEFVKYPEDQDVYLDPWLPEARKPPSE